MFIKPENKSRSRLTDEEWDFFSLIRSRATSRRFGQPLITHAMFRLIPISAPGLKTMATDKFFRIYIDFEYMMERGVEFATEVLNHEPWHNLKRHPERAESTGPNIDYYAWNLAADAEINDDIRNLIPKESIFPELLDSPDDNTAEFYYSKIMEIRDKKKKDKDKEDKSGQPTSGDKDDNKSDDKGKADKNNGENSKETNYPEKPDSSKEPNDEKGGSESDSDEKGDADSGRGDSDSEDRSQSGSGGGPEQGGNGKESKSGNATAGQAQGDADEFLPENEICSTDSEKAKEYILDEDEADSVSEFEQNIIMSEIAAKIQAEYGRNPGKVPGHMKIWADNFAKPTPTPWQKILRPAVRTAIEWTKKSKTDYHKATPNRRQPIEGIRLPALRAPTPRMLVGVDTSGSHVPLLPRVGDELYTIIKSSGVRGRNLKMISIDTHIKDKPTIINNIKDVNFSGGGGTDMLPFFDLTKRIHKNIDIALLLTDGEVPSWYKDKPVRGIKYIVCILGFEGHTRLEQSFIRAEKEMPWARVIKIEVPREELKR